MTIILILYNDHHNDHHNDRQNDYHDDCSALSVAWLCMVVGPQNGGREPSNRGCHYRSICCAVLVTRHAWQ